MDLEKCTDLLYNNKLSRQWSKGAAEHSARLDNRLLNSAKSANTASPSFWALSSPPTSPLADRRLIKLSQKASTLSSGECWSFTKGCCFSSLHSSGRRCRHELLTMLLWWSHSKSFFELKGNFCSLCCLGPELWNAGMKRGNYWWIKIMRPFLTPDQVQQVLFHLYRIITAKSH